MKKRVLCALFAAAIVATGAMAGCSGGGQVSTGSAVESKAEGDNSAASQTQTDQPSQQESKEEQKSEINLSGSLSALKATKFGKAKINGKDVDITSSGIIYQADGKYGVVSFDGKKDTGAKYAYAKEVSSDTNDKGYIVVRELAADNKNVNTCGLVDKNGELAIPCQYASINLLNDRYAKVITADKETKDKDEALVYFTEKLYSISPDEGDTMYSGKWEIFDLKSKALLKGATGTKPYNMNAKGQFVSFKNDDGKEVIMDAAGRLVTDGRQILTNGAYVLAINGKSAVYNTDEQRLFNFDAQQFEISRYEEPYYIGRKTDQNYKSTYLLVNDKGEVVSGEFEDSLSYVFPDFVLCNDTVYKLDGTKAFNDNYSTLGYDAVNKDAYYAKKDKRITIFDKDGNILFSGDEEKDGFYGGSGGHYFNLTKQSGSDNAYYNYSTKAFDIAAPTYSDVGSWLVKVGNGSVKDLIDIRTGQKLFDSSYGSYTSITDTANKVTYLYAFNSINGNVADDDFDIYTISK